MERKTFAFYTLVVGALVGVVADLLFFGKALGISFPLFILIGIVVVIASGGLVRQPLRPRNLWVLVPAIFFACMVAVRAESGINGLNVVASLALCGLALYYLPLAETLDLDTTWDHVAGVIEATAHIVFAPLFEILDSISFIFGKLSGRSRTVMAVGRGLIIAVPVLLVFAVLFSSADAVFADYVDRVWSIFSFSDMGQFYHAVMIGIIGWLACGTIAYGVARRGRTERDESKPKRKLPSLGITEALIILASVALLFGLFVIIQFAYFFGGQASAALDGLGYAEYARRGFFELVAVSLLTLGLVLALDWVTVRHAQRHTRIFRAFAVILVALTGVILVSAAQRMTLYETQFGYTALRVQTHVFMAWLAVLFGFFLLALFRVRERIFSVGVLVVMIGYLGTLNLMNVERYIAEHNIARFSEGYDLDFPYLNSFSADAAPAIIDLYATTRSPALREEAGQWLTRKLMELDRLRAGSGATIFSANLSRDTAWAALDAIRADLPEYDPTYNVRSYDDR